MPPVLSGSSAMGVVTPPKVAVSVSEVTPTLSVAFTCTVNDWPMPTWPAGTVRMMTLGAWVSAATIRLYDCVACRPPLLVTTTVIG